jgi:hypothetical protein
VRQQVWVVRRVRAESSKPGEYCDAHV